MTGLSFISACDAKLDICVLIDSSGSIRDNNPPDGSYDNWSLLLNFVDKVLEGFKIGPDATRVGVVVFSEQVNLVFPMSAYSDIQNIKAAIQRIPYLGQTTNTPEGLKVVREQCFNAANGDRPNVENLAIIVTDGVPFPGSRRDPAIQQAQLLKQDGDFMITVGITDIIDEAFLKALSSPPQKLNEQYYKATDFTVLSQVVNKLVLGVCDTVEIPKTASKFSMFSSLKQALIAHFHSVFHSIILRTPGSCFRIF